MKIRIPSDRQHNRIAFEFIKKLLKANKKILDVGAADCVLKPFFPKNIRYYSLDIKNYPGCKHDFLLDLDKEKIPVKEGFFDILLCLEVLEHTMYPERVIKELIRVSKKDSVFVFSLPNEYNFLQRFYYLFAIKTETEKPWKVVEEHRHIQKPRVKDIINLLSKDFNIKKIVYHWESGASSNNKFFAFIDKFINILAKICPNLFSRHVVVKCVRKDST